MQQAAARLPRAAITGASWSVVWVVGVVLGSLVLVGVAAAAPPRHARETEVLTDTSGHLSGGGWLRRSSGNGSERGVSRGRWRPAAAGRGASRRRGRPRAALCAEGHLVCIGRRGELSVRWREHVRLPFDRALSGAWNRHGTICVWRCRWPQGCVAAGQHRSVPVRPLVGRPRRF